MCGYWRYIKYDMEQNVEKVKLPKFFSRPSPKASRELQTVSDRRRRITNGSPLAKNQPEPVTGPWVYTEAVYLFDL